MALISVYPMTTAKTGGAGGVWGGPMKFFRQINNGVPTAINDVPPL